MNQIEILELKNRIIEILKNKKNSIGGLVADWTQQNRESMNWHMNTLYF